MEGRDGGVEGFFDDLLESAFNKGDLGHSAGLGRVARKFYLMDLDQRTSYLFRTCLNFWFNFEENQLRP